MPEVTTTVATAAVATPGKVTTTVATTVASSVTTATMAATTVAAVPSRLGRHVGCGHHQTGGSDSREGIHSGQGPKGQ
jgi:hypothetical protein